MNATMMIQENSLDEVNNSSNVEEQFNYERGRNVDANIFAQHR